MITSASTAATIGTKPAVCVVGAGAIGAHVAARLARAGFPVSAIARGDHLAAIVRDGITVRTPGETFQVRVDASDDPATLGTRDLVIVAVKAPSLPGLSAAVAPLLHASTAVIFIQNGIPWWYFHGQEGRAGQAARRLQADAIAEHIDPMRVLGCVVHSASCIAAPGVVEVERELNRLVLGEPNGVVSPRLAGVARVLEAAGFTTETTARIRDEIWLKLTMNAATGPLCALSDSTPADVFREPAALDAMKRIVAEVRSIASALGCTLGRAGLDIDAFAERVRTSRHRPSIVQDLDARRPLEIDALYQVPIDLAQALNVPAPVLGLLTGLLKQRARAAGLYAPLASSRARQPPNARRA